MLLAGKRLLLAAMTVAALTACAPAVSAPDPDATVAPVDSTQGAEAPAAEPAPLTFTEPRTCSELLGPVLEAEIINGGYDLFSSTAGSGTHYPIASTQSGSPFSCWYGVDQVDLSSFEIAAQGLTGTDKDGIGAALAGQGFQQSGDDVVTVWTKEGTQGGEPAIVHVLRADSWLTAYSEYGGATQTANLGRYLDTVADTLYE